MSVQEVRSPGQATGARERFGVLALAGLIIGGIGLYLALRASDTGRDSQRNLLPYQVLARTLPESEQQVFATLRRGLLVAEGERSRLSQWPEPSALAAQGASPFGEGSFEWQRFQEGAAVHYLGLPKDPSSSAWLLAVQEPEPNTPPDPAPLDDEHHRLPDGTTLHIYVWMHRFGGRVTPAFIRQPQAEGWTEVFSAPPNPLFLPRK